MDCVNYNDIREELDTGDIVLFSGKGGISAGIKWFTNSKWSHVGMVVRLPEWDIVLLWESTTLSDISDITTGEETQGVQLVPLSERLSKYTGDACIRKLSINVTSEMKNALSKLREELKGRPYEKNKIELIKAAYDGFFGENEENLSSLFCSELVAEAYQRMGLIREDVKSNEFTPKDFSSDSDKKFDLLKNASLSKEIYIKTNKD